MDLSKEQTLQFKGVAILFMLFLHLFNQSNNIALTDPLIHVGDTALILYLSSWVFVFQSI